MKALLTIIIAASLTIGCAMPEEEIATTDTSSGGTPTTDKVQPPTEFEGKLQWARQMGSNLKDFGEDITTDSSGNIYVAGHTEIHIEGLDWTHSNGMIDLYVMKFNKDGEKLWTRQIGTDRNDWARAITTDSNGSVFTAGETGGVFEGTRSGQSLFLIKHDSDGNQKWVRQMGSSSAEYVTGIVSDDGGNVYVAGYTYGSLDGQSTEMGTDLFIVKFDNDGNMIWVRQLGTSSDVKPTGISIDHDGNIYLAGSTEGSLGSHLNAGESDIFLVKYDSAGNQKWIQQFGTSKRDSAGGITVDSNGDISVTGSAGGTFDSNSSGQNGNFFIAKYNGDGAFKWLKQGYGNGGSDITADSNDNLIVFGSTNRNLDDNSWLEETSMMLVKFDGDGDRESETYFGSSEFDYATALSLDGANNFYVAGSTFGVIDNNTNAGQVDMFIAKFK